MPELTLARFILEFSLMNYEMVTISDSKVAAACLFIALRMNDKTGWNKQLQYYSGNFQVCPIFFGKLLTLIVIINENSLF